MLSQQFIDFLRATAKGLVRAEEKDFHPYNFPNKSRAYMDGVSDGQVQLARRIIQEIDGGRT